MTNQFITRELLKEEGWGPEDAAFQTKKISYRTFGRHWLGKLLVEDYDNICRVVKEVHGLEPFEFESSTFYLYFS